MARYLVDTNIVSELMKTSMDDYVLYWLQDNEGSLYISSVSILELHYGIMRLPEGKKKRRLSSLLDIILKELAARTFAFDGFCAYLCARMRCDVGGADKTPQLTDAMIASVAQANNCVVATRNVKDFEALGVEVVNPFDYVPPVYGRQKGQT